MDLVHMNRRGKDISEGSMSNVTEESKTSFVKKMYIVSKHNAYMTICCNCRMVLKDFSAIISYETNNDGLSLSRYKSS